jgi:dihydrofolate reductase
VIVVSRTEDYEVDTDQTELYCDDLVRLRDRLESEGAEKIWLVGGGELVASFLKKQLLDEITVSMHPILLGKGVPLFPGGFPTTLLMLKDAQAYEGGLVQLNYHVVPEDEELNS